MSISMYTASVTVFSRMLTNLLAIMEKAEANAVERKFKADVLVTQRLAPDMLPLSSQIQIATDAAKGAVARLSGREIPSWPDNETTFGDLKARVKKAIDYLATFKPNDLDGTENKQVVIKIAGEDVPLRGEDYLVGRAMQNFYFHVTTAYAILRHNGVPIGKRDYLG